MSHDTQPYWESFPNLFPGAITPKVGHRIPWHKYASSPRSSQTFCISAFGSLIDCEKNAEVLDRFLAQHFPTWESTDTRWKVHLEYADRSLLNEVGGTPTQVDTLLEDSSSVVTIESKFVADAKEGLGSCSKFPKECKGHYGPGSDVANSSCWCLLERWNGRRTPRLYWTLGRSYFRDTIFAQQQVGDACPFRGPHFQLMRNFLLASAFAMRHRKSQFGTVVICPKSCRAPLEPQVESFKKKVLRPEFENLVHMAFYDDYIEALREVGDERLVRLAEFLRQRMATETP